jgi:hypothetical protein
MGLPVLIGAGVGGLTSALRGKNILKGAALGGALGGVGSGVGSLMNGGSFLQGAGLDGLTGVAGDTVSQGAGGLLSTGAANSASLAVPTIAQSTTPLASSALAGTIESSPELMVGADGVLRNPEYFANISGASPIYTGNGSLLDKLSMGAQSVGSNLSNPFSGGMGVNNLQGAAQIASMYQPTQATPAPAGRIESGQAPSPEGYAQFMQQYYPQYKKQRTDLSV